MVHQRDAMVDALGSRWEMALAAAVGNWGLDYLALVAALYAVGAKPRLSLVLLAYGAAAVLSMIPITPGGLGFVEAGLTATLIAAGVAGSDALLATLAYRVVSYWLPLPAGLGASVLFRRRYGRVDMDARRRRRPTQAPALTARHGSPATVTKATPDRDYTQPAARSRSLSTNHCARTR